MKKVKFSLPAPAIQNATEVLLLGDFNNWLMENAIPLVQNNDGDFEIEIELTSGTYQYKYFLNDGRWENDWNAEEYWFDANSGTHNSVIHIVETTKTETPKKAAATKKTTAKKAAIEPEVVAEKTTKKVAVKKAAAPKKEKVEVEKKTTPTKDDLTKITGITAKTSKILVAAGIQTYKELSKLSAKKIKEVLVEADAKLATTEVSNWAKEAKQLATGA